MEECGSQGMKREKIGIFHIFFVITIFLLKKL
jgi:hypothetical protein